MVHISIEFRIFFSSYLNKVCRICGLNNIIHWILSIFRHAQRVYKVNRSYFPRASDVCSFLYKNCNINSRTYEKKILGVWLRL